MKRLILTGISLLFVWQSAFSQSFGRGGGAIFRGGIIATPLTLPDGTAGAPSLAFNSGTDNGLYWVDTDSFGLATNGVQLIAFGATTITAAQPIQLPNGSTTLPSLAFVDAAGDYNTGFYRSAQGVIKLTLVGTDRYIFNSSYLESAIASAFSVYQRAGTLNNVTYTFVNDYDTGLLSLSADELTIAAGGAAVVKAVEAGADYVEHVVGTVYTPSVAQSLSDDEAITIDNTIVRVVGNGGAALLDADPAIENGAADGQMIIIQGTNDVSTVTIADAVNTALAGGASVALGAGDTVQLIWDAGNSIWYEVSRSNN